MVSKRTPLIAPNKSAFKTRRWSKVAQFLEDTRGLPLKAELKCSDYCQVHFCDKQVAQVCVCVHAVEPLQAMFLSLETGSHRQHSFVVNGTGFCSLCVFIFFFFNFPCFIFSKRKDFQRTIGYIFDLIYVALF